MRDSNDNGVDDGLELLGLLGFSTHLQNQRDVKDKLRQIARALDTEKRARQAAEKRATDAERRAQEAEDRKHALPQCPWCGGRLEGKFPKCMHCASDLVWVEGTPCQPSQEATVREKLKEQREKGEVERARIEAERKRAEAEWSGVLW